VDEDQESLSAAADPPRGLQVIREHRFIIGIVCCSAPSNRPTIAPPCRRLPEIGDADHGVSAKLGHQRRAVEARGVNESVDVGGGSAGSRMASKPSLVHVLREL
jgi:hypothetical protein